MSISFLDVYDCLSSPCQNGGTCSEGVTIYACDCAAGYEGNDCEMGKAALLHFLFCRLT